MRDRAMQTRNRWSASYASRRITPPSASGGARIGVAAVAATSLCLALVVGAARLPMAIGAAMLVVAGCLVAYAVCAQPLYVLLAAVALRAPLDEVGQQTIGPLTGNAVLSIMLLAAAAMRLLVLRARPEEPSSRRAWPVAAVPLAALALWSTTGAFWGREVGLPYWMELLRLLTLAALCALAATTIRSVGDLKLLMAACVVSYVILFVGAAIGLASGIAYKDELGVKRLIIPHMLHGAYQVGALMMYGSALFCAAAVTATSQRSRAAAICLALICGLLLFRSYARSEVLGTAAALLAMAMVTRSRWLLVALVAAVLLGALDSGMAARATDFVGSGNQSSITWRLGLWTEYLGYLRQSPVYGFGLATSTVGRGTGAVEAQGLLFGVQAHNDYLRVALATGLPGVVLWMASLYLAYRQGILLQRSAASGLSRTLGLAVVGIVVGTAVASVGDNLFNFPSHQIAAWVLIGAAYPARYAVSAGGEAGVAVLPGQPRRGPAPLTSARPAGTGIANQTRARRSTGSTEPGHPVLG